MFFGGLTVATVGPLLFYGNFSKKSPMKSINKYNERDDVAPAGWAPLAHRKALRQFGGTNPYGESRYRVVLAQHVYEWHGGEFWDWPEGAGLSDQGGLVFSDKIVRKKHVIKTGDPRVPLQLLTVEQPEGMIANPSQPLRRVVESRWVSRYPELDGWILQRWRPASHWGPPKLWESIVYPGTDIQMLGPYPEKGRYEFAIEMVDDDGMLLRKSRTEIYALSHLENCIQFLDSQEQEFDKNGATPEVRMAVRRAEYEAQRAQVAQAARDTRQKEIREFIRPYLGNSLEAGRLRSDLAKKAGISSHVGN